MNRQSMTVLRKPDDTSRDLVGGVGHRGHDQGYPSFVHLQATALDGNCEMRVSVTWQNTHPWSKVPAFSRANELKYETQDMISRIDNILAGKSTDDLRNSPGESGSVRRATHLEPGLTPLSPETSKGPSQTLTCRPGTEVQAGIAAQRLP